MGNMRAQLCRTEIKAHCVYFLLFFVSWNFIANQARIIITLKLLLNKKKKKLYIWIFSAYSMVQQLKYLPAMQETQETGVQSLDGEDRLQEERAPHASILWRRKWQPTPLFSPGEFHDRPWSRKVLDITEWLTHTPVFLPEKLPWTKKPGGLQSMGLQRVGHSWACTHIFELYLTVVLKKAGSVEVVVLVVVMIIVTKTTSGYFRIFTMCQKLF